MPGGRRCGTREHLNQLLHYSEGVFPRILQKTDVKWQISIAIDNLSCSGGDSVRLDEAKLGQVVVTPVR